MIDFASRLKRAVSAFSAPPANRTADPLLDAATQALTPIVSAAFGPAATVSTITLDRATYTDDPDTDITGRPADAIHEFVVHFDNAARLSNPYRRHRAEAVVADIIGTPWNTTWDLLTSQARFTRRPPLPTMVHPPLTFATANSRENVRDLYPATAIPFGVTADGATIGWDFTQATHMVITGPTGQGTKSLLRTVGTQCARRGFNTAWIDLRGRLTAGMGDWPNVSMISSGTDAEALVAHAATLHSVATTVRDRLKAMSDRYGSAVTFDPLILLIDELTVLTEALDRSSADDLDVILRCARGTRVHVVLCAHWPPPMMRSPGGFSAVRVAMGRLSVDAAMLVFGDPVTGRRLSADVKGRATAQLPDGTAHEIQAFYTPPIPATGWQHDALPVHARRILTELANVENYWPRAS